MERTGSQEHESLEASLGVSFKSKDLLRQALTHSSYLNENPGAVSQSNERLEFLGDAVIGVVVADELYRRHPEWSEGELTEARSSLVRGETLGLVADGLDLGRHLYMGLGEAANGGRQRPTNLAAVLEALVGALFLDQGYDVASRFTLRSLSAELSTLYRPSALKDHKSTLQETVQAKGLSPLSYETVDVSGETHAPHFTVEVTVAGQVVGRGAGKRKSVAEQEAAADALRTLDDDSQA